MRVVLLSPASAIHSVRWANGLAQAGVEVHLIGIHDSAHVLDPNVTVHRLPYSAPVGYALSAHQLKKLLRHIQPDLLNAHYATGYGLLARLSQFKPLLLSVWGSDVYDFPAHSAVHRWLLRGNLKAATAIGSTSHCMARQTARTYPHPHTFITPFGVDEVRFSPRQTSKVDDTVVIGTVKSLASRYGIDVLLRAYALVKQQLGGTVKTRLEIWGTGPDAQALQGLAHQLGISGNVVFRGWVAHDKVPEALHELDIYVALSRAESFGVAILEACACGKPVVVSDAEGPAEVTVSGKTGLVVPKDDPKSAADAMVKLILNPSLRVAMGDAGRQHVLESYSWSDSVKTMVNAYKETINLASRA